MKERVSAVLLEQRYPWWEGRGFPVHRAAPSPQDNQEDPTPTFTPAITHPPDPEPCGVSPTSASSLAPLGGRSSSL